MRRRNILKLAALITAVIFGFASSLASHDSSIAPQAIIVSVVKREKDLEYKLRYAREGEISLTCPDFVWDKVVVSSADRGALGNLISCRIGKEDNRKIAIWVHGGPWSYAGTELVLEQLAFLEAGYDLFVPLYPGSSDRPTIFEGIRMVPSGADALAELNTALDWSRRNYELVDVVGESFGAFLAVSLVPRLNARESLLLINPSLGGQRYLTGHYARKGAKLAINDVGNAATQAEAKRLTEAYFKTLVGYDPIRQLQATPPPNLKLIHGGADKLLVGHEIALLRKLAVPRCGVDFRPTSGHEFGFTQKHFNAARNLIRCQRVSPTKAVPH